MRQTRNIEAQALQRRFQIGTDPSRYHFHSELDGAALSRPTHMEVSGKLVHVARQCRKEIS